MVAFVDALGIDGIVKQNPDSVLLIFAQEGPQDREAQADPTNGQSEPPQTDTAGKSHADEDKHENQRHTHITGQRHVQAEQQHQMHQHVKNRNRMGDSVLVGRHDGSVDNNIGDLTDLRRLDVDGKSREVQPASVTGAVVGTEGDQQQKQNAVERHHDAPMLRKEIHIQGGNKDVHQHPQEYGGKLNGNVTEISAGFGRGGAGNDHDSEAGYNQAQDQQEDISLLGRVF